MYVATVIFKIDDNYNDRKPDISMVAGHIADRIKTGVIENILFRQSVSMKINDVKVVVQEV